MNNWFELSQCDNCSNLQRKYQKPFICKNCFNPSQTSNSSKKRSKKPYYHQLTRKYENLIDNLNQLIDLGVYNNLIGKPFKKFSLVDSRDLGVVEDLEAYQFPLILLNINLLKVQNQREVVLSQNNLIQELLNLFENFILPKCTLFLPQKLYNLNHSKKEHKLLLFAILTRSEFLCKSQKLSYNNKAYSFLLEDNYFYKCYKSLLVEVNEPCLELIQSLLLIGDLETSSGFSLLKLNSVKAIAYSQTLYLHELNNNIHKADTQELLSEKVLTWLNLIIMEQKSYFYYSSQRLKKVNYLENIKELKVELLPIGIRKWVIHVELIAKISVNMVNAMRLKSILKETPLELSSNLTETLETFLDFIKSANLGKLPQFYFGNSTKLEFNSYHSAILFQYIFYHMAKLCILDLFDSILNSPELINNLSDKLKISLKLEISTNIKSAQKIMEIALETNNLHPLTATHLSHLEVSHSVFLWSYFFSFRTLLKTNKIKFNELDQISKVMEKLKKFIELWPTNKNLYDILTLDLEGRGISISYFELNLN